MAYTKKELIDRLFDFKEQTYRLLSKRVKLILSEITNLKHEVLNNITSKSLRLTANDFMSLRSDWRTKYRGDLDGMNVCNLCSMKSVCQDYLSKNKERVIINFEDWDAVIKNYGSCYITDYQENNNDEFYVGFKCVSGKYVNPEDLICLGFLDNDNPENYQKNNGSNGYYTWSPFKG